jgi:putative transposase
VKYACIAQHRGPQVPPEDRYPVRLMCRVLDVSAAGFYAWATRAPSARARANDELMLDIRIAHQQSGGDYGAPRIQQALRRRGLHVGKNRIARQMRQHGLVGRAAAPKRRPRTTDSAHQQPVAPNRLARQFDVTGIGALDRVWASDITYLPTREGWLFLAVVLDLASRRVIGWAMQPTLDLELALRALRMALGARQPAPGLLHHSDRGTQYAAAEYQGVLRAHGIVASMSRKGNCWDNAVVESFFGTLELELIVKHDWRTRDEARGAVFRYIETWYNRRRLHSTLGYRSPAEYEAEVLTAVA